MDHDPREGTPPDEQAPIDDPRADAPAPSLLRYGLAFGLVCALLAFFPLASETFRLLFGEGDGRIQPGPVEGLPVHARFIWGGLTMAMVRGAATLTPGFLLTIETFLLLLLAYALLRLLNPTFRLTTGVTWDTSLLFRTYMHTGPLIKAFLIAVTAAVPLGFLCWGVSVALGGGRIALYACGALAGAVVWFLFSREGVAADYESGAYEFPRDRAVQASLVGRGALAGLAVAMTAGQWPIVPLNYLFGFFRSLGLIGERQWWCIAAAWSSFAFALGIAGAAVLVCLGPGRSPIARRLTGAAVWGLFLAGAIGLGRVWLPAHLAARYDFRPMDPTPAQFRLARVTHARLAPGGFHSVLVFGDTHAGAFSVGEQAIDGLDLSDDAMRRVRAFVERRSGLTALHYAAFVALHDGASARMDPDAALRLDAENLERCADPDFMRLTFQGLQSCAASGVALRVLDRMVQGGTFVMDDRDSRVFVGDLYAHLGERTKAEQWYTRAGMPGTRILPRLNERTMFAEGRVTGRLLLNGAPVAGARVGIIPVGALSDIGTMFWNVEQRRLRPFWLRWVSAATDTDAAGRFRLDRVIAGHYRLIVMLPDARLPATAAGLPVTHAPGDIFLAYGDPARDLGDIAIASR